MDTDWIRDQHDYLDTITPQTTTHSEVERKMNAKWGSPMGNWRTYRAVSNDYERQKALDGLRDALHRIAYVQGWAKLDSAEQDSLSGAVRDIEAAIKEFSR